VHLVECLLVNCDIIACKLHTFQLYISNIQKCGIIKTIGGKMNKRGFEVVSVFKFDGVNIPTRKTSQSAGYDLESIEDIIIEPNSRTLIKTGIKAYMEKDEVLKLYIRSSLAYKNGLMLANGVGVIDADYYNNPDNEGHIMVLVYNPTNSAVVINKNDRIAQGIFEKYLVSETDNSQSIRTGGFGSTGKN
jgi:dUTP pyrophosphatase